MIYFDNAATSRTKPEVVYDAFNHYIRDIAVSPGRGSYSLGITASRMLYQSRKTVSDFFGSSAPENVVFTKNSTEAINLFFNGFLKKGDHVLISCYEHNAVLRPLHSLKQEGVIDYTILPEHALYDDDCDLKKFIKSHTKLAAITLASNLTGQIVFSSSLAEKLKSYGLTVFVDASQGAGKKLLDMRRDSIDVLAFTGHKDLLGLPGVGGLYSVNDLRITPLIQGGTGIYGDSYINPQAFPEAYEAGTLNMPAIWALKNAMEYINEHIAEMNKKESELTKYLMKSMLELPNVVVYNADKPRVSTLAFNVKGKSSSDIVALLDKNEICVRGGIHCAILAHETLGTVETGAVRVSLNSYNTKDEIDAFIKVIGGIN